MLLSLTNSLYKWQKLLGSGTHYTCSNSEAGRKKSRVSLAHMNSGPASATQQDTVSTNEQHRVGK